MADAGHVASALSALGGPGESAAVDSLAATLAAGGGNITALVTHLGPQLTSTDETARGRGTQLLAEVLRRLPTGSLAGGEVDHLVRFFSNRLGDYPTIGAVLSGLRALVRSPLPEGGALDILTHLLEECDVRGLVQGQRHAAMSLILELVHGEHWGVLAPSGSRLALSTVRALDGEKDPRNLLLYLQLLRVLCERCEGSGVGGFEAAIDEVFDSLVCYFPITFTPPPNDPYQITAQHLLQALLRTLRASPRFAPKAFKFFAEKLAEVAHTDEGDGEAEIGRLQVRPLTPHPPALTAVSLPTSSRATRPLAISSPSPRHLLAISSPSASWRPGLPGQCEVGL